MKDLLGMLNMSKVGGVQEDAFMAVGTLVECRSPIIVLNKKKFLISKLPS